QAAAAQAGAAAAADPTGRADAAGHAASAEEPDARRLPARVAADAARAAPAGPAAEELVQDGRQIGGLRVLDLVEERLASRRLVLRQVEDREPVGDLVEGGLVVRERDDRVEPRERDEREPGLAFAGGRDAVRGEQLEQLVREVVGVALLQLEDARME